MSDTHFNADKCNRDRTHEQIFADKKETDVSAEEVKIDTSSVKDTPKAAKVIWENITM